MKGKHLLKRYPDMVVWLGTLVVTAGALLLWEYHLLWKIQELSLFLWTPMYFKQQMVVAGGLLTWLGTFFTQFLYQPWVGVLMLCSWWLLLLWILKHAFQIPTRWGALLLIPVALLLVADVDMGYWIYVIKFRGWFFAPTIGTTMVAALLWAYRRLPTRYGTRQILLVTTTIVGYPLVGIYALAATLLMGIWTWRLEETRGIAVINTILAVLIVVAMPLLYYRFVYYQTNIVNIYWVGLPIFRIVENYPNYYIPYYLLAGFFLLLVVGVGRKMKNYLEKPFFSIATQTVLGVVMMAGVTLSWFKDENFHHEVAMMHYVEYTHWNDVLKEATRQQEEPTRAIVMMRNLALARLGRQSTEMYRYPGGSQRPASPFPIQASQLVGSMIYYNYGMMNDSHHLCIEAGVEYGWRINHLTYLARTALLNGDSKVMLKYTGLLKHALYYDHWAQLLEDLQRHPKHIVEARETAPILHMMQYEDMVGADNGYTEKYLMGIMADTDADDPYFQEQCLLATLWTKKSDQFWRQFSKYTQLHPNRPIPRYYQEAVYLFAHKDRPEALTLPFDAGVKETYERFMEQYRLYDGKSKLEARQNLYPLYGDTFYFDYFLLNELTYF